MRVVVIYYSRTGTTKKMAEIIKARFEEKEVDCDVFSIEDIVPKQLLDYNGIIIGSPTYYGTLAGNIKTFLDERAIS